MDMPVKDSPGLCRCCFSEGCYKDLSTAYAWMGDTEIYADMLLECFDISITQHVDGPNGPNRLICEVCITRLRDASNFKKQVLNCEKKFIDMVAKGAFKASTSEFNVQVSVEKEPKLEPILEEDIETPNLDYLDDLDYDDDFDPKGEASTSHQSDDNEPLAKLTTRKRKLKPKKETATKAAKGKAPKVVKKEEKPKATKKEKTINTDIVKAMEDTAKKKKQDSEIPRRRGRPKLPWGQSEKAVDQFYIKAVNENMITLIQFTSIVPFVWFKNRFQCFLCNEVCILISELRTHVKNEHSVLETLKAAHVSFSEVKFDITGLQCRVCFEYFEEFDAIVDHINVKHAAGFNKEYRNYFMPFKIGDTETPCLHCNKVFSNVQVLLRHLRKHHIEGKYLCRSCGLSYVYSFQLDFHMKACHFKEFNCKKCDKIFTYNGARKKHMATEHGISERKCRICQKTFVTHYQLRKHEFEAHDIGLRISCKQCPAKFITQTNLNAHIASAHSEKVKCGICDKSLKINALKKHMRGIHQRTETFICGACNQEYTNRNSLKRHQKKQQHS